MKILCLLLSILFISCQSSVQTKEKTFESDIVYRTDEPELNEETLLITDDVKIAREENTSDTYEADDDTYAGSLPLQSYDKEAEDFSASEYSYIDENIKYSNNETSLEQTEDLEEAVIITSDDERQIIDSDFAEDDREDDFSNPDIEYFTLSEKNNEIAIENDDKIENKLFSHNNDFTAETVEEELIEEISDTADKESQAISETAFVSKNEDVIYNDKVLRYADLLKNYQLKQQISLNNETAKVTEKPAETERKNTREEVKPKFDFTNVPVKYFENNNNEQELYYYQPEKTGQTSLSSNSNSLIYDDIEKLKIITSNRSPAESNLTDETLKIEEKEQINIALNGSGWLIKIINSQFITPVSRTNHSERTWFILTAEYPGNTELVFIRYDQDKNQTITKKFSVNIVPKKIFEEKNNAKKNAKPNNQRRDTETDYRRNIADNLFKDRNYKAVINSYEDILKTSPGDAQLFYKLANSYFNTGNQRKAEEYYRRNLSDLENPYFNDSVVEYLDLLKNQGKFKEGVDLIYNIGLPNVTDEISKELLYLIAGDLNFNLKNYSESLRNYRTFLSIYPASVNYDKALFYLAYSMELLDNPQYREARNLYSQLISRFPESKYLNLSRSRILYLDRHYLRVN